MEHFDQDRQPEDLEEVARRLRNARTDASALELDQIKVRAMRQAAATPRDRGTNPMRSRFAALTSAAVLAVAGGTTFAIAKSTSSGKSDNSAADKQYNGKKCGNPNKPQSKPPGNPDNDVCPPQSDK